MAALASSARIVTLAAADTANVTTTQAASATASASAWPAPVRTRPGPVASAVLIVPRPQSPPASAAPSTANVTAPAEPNWVSAMITNWPGSIDGRS